MNTRLVTSLATASIISIVAAGPAFAGIVVTSGLVDVGAQAISGKNGSVVGPISDDPAAVNGLSGTVSSNAFATAGPIPLDPNNQSFPGTTGIASASAAAGLVFVPSAANLTITGRISSQNDFQFMDAGGYLGNAASYFKTEFLLDVDTPWSMTGTAAFNLQDPLANLRLVGPFGTYVNLTAANNGPFAFAGILPAGGYLFEGFAAVGESLGGALAVGAFNESGSVFAELVLVPTPSAAVLLGLGVVGAARRRR